MKALVFRYSLPRLAYATVFGKITPRAYLSPGSPLCYEDIPEPKLLADDWAIVKTALCGICGSDSKQIFLDGNFDNPLTSLISFPQVLGHEAVGIVEQVGKDVTSLKKGDRVVLNPWLSCEPRGFEPKCQACQRGDYYLCEHFTDGDLPPGMHIGNCSPVTGGFASQFAAHQSLLLPIPDSVSFDQAVLADPFSVSLHAVLKAPPKEGDLALVYGCGTLGLLTIVILRALYPQTPVIAIVKYPHQECWTRRLGAEYVIRTPKGGKLIEKVAEIVGARVFRPWNGKPMLMGGPGVIYDTIGSPDTLEIGLRIAHPQAKYVITGVANPARFEWTPLYFKEIEVIGSNAFGIETYEGQRLHAMNIYLKLLEQDRIDVGELITHRYKLEQYRQAFLAAHDKRKSEAVKVVFNYD